MSICWLPNQSDLQHLTNHEPSAEFAFEGVEVTTRQLGESPPVHSELLERVSSSESSGIGDDECVLDEVRIQTNVDQHKSNLRS